MYTCRRAVLTLPLGLLVACGGDDHRRLPTTPSPPPSGLASGTSLTMVSGETGAPVAGVSVTIGGVGLTSDPAGQVRLSATAPPGTSIDMIHADYLDRLSTVRTGSSQRFALWPKVNDDGMTEHYTAVLVYTAASDPPGPVSEAPMVRLARGTATVVVVPSEEILADGPAMEAHYAAVASINQAIGGAVTYVLAPTRPAGGVVVTTRLDPNDRRCVDNTVRGYMRGTYRGLEVISADVVLCTMGIARSSTVAHELGHTFGLQHASDSRDLMGIPISRNRATSFGSRESLLMRLMLDRPAGNRFPDNDRGAAPAAQAEEGVITCR